MIGNAYKYTQTHINLHNTNFKTLKTAPKVQLVCVLAAIRRRSMAFTMAAMPKTQRIEGHCTSNHAGQLPKWSAEPKCSNGQVSAQFDTF